MAKVSEKIRQRALVAIVDKNYAEAKLLYDRVLAIDPRDAQALGNLSISLDALGDYEEFHKVALRALEIQPEDMSVINKVAISEYKLGRHQAAYDRLTAMVKSRKMTFETAMNLCSISGELGLDKEGLTFALEALQLQPTSSIAHNNLGSAFMTMGLMDEARHCFETTLMIEPENSSGLVNLGVIANKTGNHLTSADFFKRALAETIQTDTLEISRIRFFLALTQMASGELEDAWNNYEFGWNLHSGSGRNPNRTFEVPRWAGQPVAGKKVLVWREQGLGDELFFFSAVKSLVALGADVIIECDPRLVDLLQRSYPTALVRGQQFFAAPPLNSYMNDFEYQIPAGSLFGHFRPSIGAFHESGPYLVPAPNKVSNFEKRLGQRGQLLRVGICWRSNALQASRIVHYSALSAWGGVLGASNVQIVNLQYGDTVKEVADAEAAFGVSLNSWTDIDRKDDLDELAALISTLDLVITVGTAVAQISAAIGVPVWLLHVTQDWPQFGQTNYPVYPNVTMIKAPVGGSVSDLLAGEVPEKLAQLVNASNVTDVIEFKKLH